MSVVSFRDILRFYIPLVLNSQMMTLSGPIINVAVGRAADPKLEFAAYWIGFTTLLFIESPCLIIQQVTASLLRGYHTLRRILLGALVVSALASVTVLIVALTPVGDVVFDELVRTTPRTAELARKVLALFAPLPIFVSLRGVGNGVAIRAKRTPLIARATLFRILSLSVVVGFVVGAGTGSGAMAGVAALQTGIIFETLVIWIGIRPHWRRMRDERHTDVDFLSKEEFVRVALPLVVSGFAWTSFRPIVNAILGRLDDPELAQAGFGVVMPLLLWTTSPLWSMQNVSLILPETQRDIRRVIRFAILCAAWFSTIVLIIVVTPLRDLILTRFFALSPELERVVTPALWLLIFEPVFLGIRSVAQGILLRAKQTVAFLYVAPIRTALIAVVGFWFVSRYPDVNGTLLGVSLFVGGSVFDAIVYSLVARRLAIGTGMFATPEAVVEGTRTE